MAEGAELGGGEPGERGEEGSVSRPGGRGSHLGVTEPDNIAAVFMSVIECSAERGPEQVRSG